MEKKLLKNIIEVERYLEILLIQEALYPKYSLKLRFVENHDKERAMKTLHNNLENVKVWTAFSMFNKGPYLLYAGQESGCFDTPSLFDITPIENSSQCLAPLIKKLSQLKKHHHRRYGELWILLGSPAIVAAWQSKTGGLLGIFNVQNKTGNIKIPLPNGDYTNLLSTELNSTPIVSVSGNLIPIPKLASILEYSNPVPLKELASPIFRR